MIYCSGTDEGAVCRYYHGNGPVHDPLAAGCISRIYSGRMTKRLSVNQKPQKEISSLSGITFNAPRFVIIRDAPPLAIKSFTFCLPNHIQYEFNPLQSQQKGLWKNGVDLIPFFHSPSIFINMQENSHKERILPLTPTKVCFFFFKLLPLASSVYYEIYRDYGR